MALIDLQYKGLTGALGTLTDFDDTTSIDDLIAAIAADEGIETNYYQISKEGDPSNTLSEIYGDSSAPASVASLGIADGDRIICTTNQTGTKEARQKQKLDIAAVKRSDTYDITQLPTQYSGNTVTDNPNSEGLLEGRPWAVPPVPPFANPTPTSTGSGVSVVEQSPFAGGGNSYLYDGTDNAIITFPASDDWAVGTGDFTIEWFSRQSNLTTPQFQRIFSVGDFPNIKIGVSIESGTFYYWANNSFRYSSSGASQANVWIHWAVVRANGVTRVYKNGTQLGAQITDTNNITENAVALTIGNTLTPSANAALVGNLTNFRWVKGLAVYTGNFTVPTAALTATADANPYGGSNTAAIPSGVTKLLLVP